MANIRVILALLFTTILTAGLVSACGIFNSEPPPPPSPETAAIHAPPENIRTLVGSPVQIHSTHPGGDNLSRVELWIGGGAIGPETLQRSDTPTNGFVVQAWNPPAAGVYLIKVKGIAADGTELSSETRQIEAIEPQVLLGSAIAGADSSAFIQPEPTEIAAPLAATPMPGAEASSPDAGAAFVLNSITSDGPIAAEEPPLHYPPPPPAPGVPPGPTQAELSPYTAPVCDAAKYQGHSVPESNQRQFVQTDDEVAAKAVGGTLIHRAWRLQNIGTCTWGPGYELAFYGGRSMGSGGVVFENTFPTDAARRNVLIDNNRLIVPEGKPNQTAVLEVLLSVPTTPGIHQSYWRMRNPHGVFFGPIMGVTLDVQRDCPGSGNGEVIYGAPQINRFVILGVGDVFEPENPVNVVVKRGEDLTLEWNITNATNFDIVFRDPTGDIESVSTSDPNSRATFPTGIEGDHVITMYADNGFCTAELTVNVKVVPREGDGFSANVAFASNAPVSSANANVAFSSNVSPGTVEVQWQHFDDNVTEVILHIDRFRQRTSTNCALEDWLGDWLCSKSDEWQKIGSETVTVGRGANGAAAVCQDSPACRSLSGSRGNLPVEISSNDHAQLIFCPAGQGDTGVQFYLEARTNSGPAQPRFSNAIDVQCSTLATELQDRFDPSN